MKVSPILVKYLAANSTLRLPGLGIFSTETPYDPNVDYSKKGALLLNVTFEYTKVAELDEDLIDFVAGETGKMKVLTKSDILSELKDTINSINTGKPCFIGGLGTLVKKIDGSIEFHKEKFQQGEKERKRRTAITETNTVPQSYIDENRKHRNTKPTIMVLLIGLLAIATTVVFYFQNKEKDSQIIEEDNTTVVEIPNPPATIDSVPTTGTSSATAPAPDSNLYNYILEITKQPRASKRYSQLKNINWPIQMQTTDSVHYKLFIQLPVSNGDTTKIKDSLSALYGKKVRIEP